MSYDLYLTADLGGKERVGVDVLPHWNYTSNVASMWRKAMPSTDGLAGMHGMQAGAAAAHLRAGIAKMEADPDTYRKLNPENGWGCFDGEHGQLGMLKVLLDACERAPKATVEVSR